MLIDRDIDISNDSICNHDDDDDVQSELDDTFAALIVVNLTIKEYDVLESIEGEDEWWIGLNVPNYSFTLLFFSSSSITDTAASVYISVYCAAITIHHTDTHSTE